MLIYEKASFILQKMPFLKTKGHVLHSKRRQIGRQNAINRKQRNLLYISLSSVSFQCNRLIFKKLRADRYIWKVSVIVSRNQQD